MSTQAVGTLAVVGTGLIGASAALAARTAGVARVVGWDPDPDHLAVAAERGAVDPAASLDDAVATADVVLVASPVGELPETVRVVLEHASEGSAVTDVGSTKVPVCAAAGDDPRFVGGHPICGAETRGPDRASGDLFQGATWFMTPTATTSPERLRRVHGLVASLGARPVAIGPDAHDRLVAVTSHLPHVLANVLLNQAGSARIDGHDPLQAAGGSLRDMTRIGGANPRIWVDIFLDNGAERLEDPGEHARPVGDVDPQPLEVARVGERRREHAPPVPARLADPARQKPGIARRQRALDLLQLPPLLAERRREGLAVVEEDVDPDPRVGAADPRHVAQ